MTAYELAVLRRFVDVQTVCNTPGLDCQGCPDYRVGAECSADNGEKALEALEILGRLLDEQEKILQRSRLYLQPASRRLIKAARAYGLGLPERPSIGYILGRMIRGELSGNKGFLGLFRVPEGRGK